MSSSWEQHLCGTQRTEGALDRQAQAFIPGFLRHGVGKVALLLRWPEDERVHKELRPHARSLLLTRHSVSKYPSRLPKTLTSHQPAALPINERTN